MQFNRFTAAVLTSTFRQRDMNAFIEATKWPMGFEPDDTTSLLQCTIVNERTAVGTSVGQHVHQTGQFVVALSGLVGLALGLSLIHISEPTRPY